HRLRTYAVMSSLPRTDSLTRCYRVSIGQRARLEHAVVVGDFLRDRLDHVPILDHLAVLELENVYDGVAARARLAHGMDMDDDVIAVGEDALDLAAVVRELVLQEGDEALEAFPAVGRQRIVLGIAGAEILRGFLEVLLVERSVVEGGDDLLILLHLLGGGGKRGGARDQQRKGNGEYRANHLNLLCRSDANSHARREPQRDDRKGYQNDQPNEVGHDERQDAGEDRREVYVLDHAFYDEHDHSHGRMDQPQLHRHHDDDAEPDRVETEFLDHRKDDRDRQDHHGKRIHQAS